MNPPDELVFTGREKRNATRFEHCRQYTGASTLRFDDMDSDAKATQPGMIELPEGLLVESVLMDTILGAQAARGDRVSAKVTADVRRSGGVMIPKGAVLTGRITHVEKQNIRSAVYLGIGLIFQTIEFAGRRGEFRSELEAGGNTSAYSIGRSRQSGERLLWVKTQTDRVPAGTRLQLRTR